MYGMDFAFDSETGDILKAPPKVNEKGLICYRHPDGTIRTESGERAIPYCDIGVVRGKQSIVQVIKNRLLTDNPDWFHHPTMGSDLTDLIGEPNTRETAYKGVDYITNALTYNNFLSPGEFSIRPVPISETEILFVLTIALPNEDEFRLPLVFDIERGLKEVHYEEE